MIICKSKREIAYLLKAGSVAAQAQERMAEIIAPGITTREIDRIAEEFISRNGARPAFKGYRGFPASVCASVNDEVVHGIPGDRVLKEGDIVSLDVGTIMDGFYGDCARTVPVGKVSKEAENLIQVTRKSLEEGIARAQEGGRLTDISHAIQNYVEKHGYSVVRDYVGHGIGRSMHESPQIPNFGPPNRGPRLKKGMTLAIEPMVNCGNYEVKTLKDGWTVVTCDGSLSAHFEDSIVIDGDRAQILTKP